MSTIQFLGIVFANCLLVLGLAWRMLKLSAVQMFVIESCEKLSCRIFGKNVIFSPFYPNNITYARGALAFIAMTKCLDGELRVAVACFIVSAFGDALDGMVARACGLGTKWGKFIDPLFDKITYLPLLVAFAMKGWLAVCLVEIFFTLEFIGQFFVRWILSKLGLSMAANNFGKFKANIAFFLVIYMFILQENSGILNRGDMILTGGIIFAVLSIVFKVVSVEYFKRFCIKSFTSLRKVAKI